MAQPARSLARSGGVWQVRSMWMTLTTQATIELTGWGGADWVLRVVIPAVLLAVGLGIFLRGRSALSQSQRLRGGFGGPPGSMDVGTELGFEVDEDLGATTLGAQRQMLWGGVLGGLGAIWLVVTLLTTLL